MDKQTIFTKADWLEACALLFPAKTPEEREAFWNDANMANADTQRYPQARKPDNSE